MKDIEEITHELLKFGNKEFKVEKIDDVLSLKKDLIESALPHFE